MKTFQINGCQYLPKQYSSNIPRGFSLIEVLITMLVVAVGMLGVAKLQLNALKDLHNAHLHTRGTDLANQIGNVIGINRNTINHFQLNKGQQLSLNVDCKVSKCSVSQLAAYELLTWQQQVQTSLPSGSAEIKVNGKVADIVVRWDENNNGSTGLNCPPVSNNDLECSRISRRY